ncbi:MAG: hypothetical protein R3Y19_00660 [Rikenellaceae bacterium]
MIKLCKKIPVLILLLVMASSCAMRTAIVPGQISDVSFNPFLGSTLSFKLHLKENNLKKEVSLLSGTVTLGEEQSIVLRLKEPITIAPQQSSLPMSFEVEMSGGINILSAIQLVNQAEEMPVEFDFRVQLGKRGKGLKIKKATTLNLKEQLKRLKGTSKIPQNTFPPLFTPFAFNQNR